MLVIDETAGQRILRELEQGQIDSLSGPDQSLTLRNNRVIPYASLPRRHFESGVSGSLSLGCR